MSKRPKIRLPVPYRPPQTTTEKRAFGAIFGERAAQEKIAKYGCSLARLSARDLELNARLSDADAFDRAYAKAYRTVVDRCKR